jgi:hypothetical protein
MGEAEPSRGIKREIIFASGRKGAKRKSRGYGGDHGKPTATECMKAIDQSDRRGNSGPARPR